MNQARSYEKFLASWRARHEPGAMRMLTIFYWRTLVCAAALFFVGALVWGSWELQTSLSILDKAKAPQKTQAPMLSRKDVDDTVALFKKKEATYTFLQSNASSTPDPSL